MTETRLLIEELVDGELEDSEVMVRTLGGQVGDVGQVVHGEAVLVRNRRAVVFLSGRGTRTSSVTAMAQGHYPVRPDGHGKSRLALSPRLGHLLGTGDASATVRLLDRELDAATLLIRSAWSRGSRRGR